jgi:hypothetical protein
MRGPGELAATWDPSGGPDVRASQPAGDEGNPFLWREDDLASGPAGLADLMCLRCFGQWQHGVDLHPEMPCVDQGHQPFEAGVVRLDQEAGDSDATFGCGREDRGIATTGHRYQQAAGLECWHGA